MFTIKEKNEQKSNFYVDSGLLKKELSKEI